MSKEEIDDVICEIMIKDGPDGHIDGHEIITAFVIKTYNQAIDDAIEFAKKHFTGDGKFYPDLVQTSLIKRLQSLKK